MDIGKEKEKITVEPLKDPVPQRQPAPSPEPQKVPQREREKVPAGA
jgi:hypothetical protein